MGRRVQLREVTEDERQQVKRLARSRTAPARTVERAQVVQVVQAAVEGAPVEAIAVQLRLARNTVYLWLHRFEVQGVAGLQDQPRGGRPPTYSREQVGAIVATALTDPQTLGLPFTSWTLDRLVAYGWSPTVGRLSRGAARHPHEAQPPRRGTRDRRAALAQRGDLVW